MKRAETPAVIPQSVNFGSGCCRRAEGICCEPDLRAATPSRGARDLAGLVLASERRAAVDAITNLNRREVRDTVPQPAKARTLRLGLVRRTGASRDIDPEKPEPYATPLRAVAPR